MSHVEAADVAAHGRGGEHLVRMANDIAHFYAAFADPVEGRREAAGHLRKFWAAPMRKAFFEHLDAVGLDALEPFMRSAVEAHRASLLEGTQSAER